MPKWNWRHPLNLLLLFLIGIANVSCSLFATNKLVEDEFSNGMRFSGTLRSNQATYSHIELDSQAIKNQADVYVLLQGKHVSFKDLKASDFSHWQEWSSEKQGVTSNLRSDLGSSFSLMMDNSHVLNCAGDDTPIVINGQVLTLPIDGTIVKQLLGKPILRKTHTDYR